MITRICSEKMENYAIFWRDSKAFSLILFQIVLQKMWIKAMQNNCESFSSKCTKMARRNPLLAKKIFLLTLANLIQMWFGPLWLPGLKNHIHNSKLKTFSIGGFKIERLMNITIMVEKEFFALHLLIKHFGRILREKLFVQKICFAL